MNPKTGPSESFRFQEEDKQTREEVFEKGILEILEDVVHYYGSGDDLEEDQLHMEELEQDKSPTFVQSIENSIRKFLKLRREFRRATTIRKLEPLVEYSQSQFLTSSKHMSNLECIATAKERVQQEKKNKMKEKEANKARKAKEKE